MIIKPDVYRLFEDIHVKKVDLLRLNYTFMILVPKKSESLSVGDYQPISLIHGIMKIISKTLSIRLSNFMEKLISMQ